MARFCTNLMRYLDFRDIKYSVIDEYTLIVPYKCENLDLLRIVVSFDEDGSNQVHLMTSNIASFQGGNGRQLKGLLACNLLNSKVRWVKFYLDDDDNVIADCDAIVDSDTVGEECLSLIRRIVGIVDDAYPIIMKTLWAL